MAILYGVLTGLGKGAFGEYRGNAIVIPDSVTSIGSFVFSGCTAEIRWGENAKIKDISPYQFEGYNGNSIVIPDSVTSIGSGAFSGCSSLESITIPFVGAEAGKTSSDTYQYPLGYLFGTYSYTGATKVTQYYFGSSTSRTTYDYYYIPSSLRSVTVTGGAILYGAFYNCSMLTSVTIGNSVTSIGNNAFTYCTGLTSVTIGNSVTSIGSNAFYGCTGLTSVYYTGDIAGWCVIDGLGNIMENRRTLYIGGQTLEGELIIPDTVTEIKSAAFYNCAGLTSVTIGNSVTSIGSNAFSGCTGLTSIAIPDSVTSLGERAFYNCKGLTSVPIPNSVRSIGDYAFLNCTGLTSVAIPDSVTSIGGNAFLGCAGMTSVTIGTSVKSIGYAAFAGCYKLVEVYNKSSLNIKAGDSSYGDVGYYAKNVYTEENGSWFTDTAEGYRFLYDGEKGYLIGYYGEAKDITLPESFSAYDGTTITTYEIYQYAFRGNTALISVTISDFVTSIGDWAFYYCTGLISVTIGNSVERIGGSAFAYCAGLTSVTIGNSVTSIGDDAFRSCTGLTSVTIPDSVTSIGWSAFRNCTGLTSVTIGNSVESIGRYAFDGCTGLTEVYYTGDIAGWCGISFGDEYANPLYYAGNLYIDGQSVTDLVIPDSVTEIKGYAFYGCTGLTSVTIGTSVTSIGRYAFSGCTELSSVVFGDTEGWQVSSSSDFSNYTSLSSAELAYASTAAIYLKSTYLNYYWRKI